MNQWVSCGIVIEGDPIDVGGVNPWNYPWESIKQPPVKLPHPSYPKQRHKMWIYEIEAGGTKVVFAAGELSANVWGFYIPAEPASQLETEPFPHTKELNMSHVDKDKVISLVIKLSLLSAGLLIGGLCAFLAPTPGPKTIDQLVRMEGTVGVETGTRMSRNRDYEYPMLVLGREKYHYLDWFPEAEKLPGRIRQGEPIVFWVDRENRWVWQIQTPAETIVTFAAVRKAVDQRQSFQKMGGFLMILFGVCAAMYTAYKSQPLWPEGESSTPYNPNPKPKKKKCKKPNLNED